LDFFSHHITFAKGIKHHSKISSQTTMSRIWQRHPRYSLFIFICLASTFYLLGPYQASPPPSSSSTRAWIALDLPSRLARSEHIYQKLLKDRQGLIK
jgi:hypothetical protein